MTTNRRRAASVISLYASKAFNCAFAISAAGKLPSSIAVFSLSWWRERFDSARDRPPSRSKHFQSPRRPFSRLTRTIFTAQVPSAAKSDKRTSVHKREGQENGYGRYCNHNLRRALPCTPPDVAVLFSAGYLTLLTSFGIVICAGNERCRAPRCTEPPAASQKHTLDQAGNPDASAVAGGSVTPAGDIACAFARPPASTPSPGNEMKGTAKKKEARPHPDQEDHVFIPDAHLIYAVNHPKLIGAPRITASTNKAASASNAAAARLQRNL